MAFGFQSIESGSPFKRLNPLTIFLVCLAWLLAATVLFDPVFLGAVIVVVALALVLLNGTPIWLLAAYMVPFMLFGMGFVMTNLLFRQDSDFAVALAGESLFASGALSAGLTLSLRAVACGMVSIFFALTIDPGAFVRTLMRYLKFPHSMGYALFVAMQMVPDLVSEAQTIRMARAMRAGRTMGRLPGPGEMAGLMVPLLAFAIRRAGRSATAMEARGFGAYPTRTMIGVPGFAVRDAVFAATGLVALAALITHGSWL